MNSSKSNWLSRLTARAQKLKAPKIDETLCSICSKLDFHKMFETVAVNDGVYVDWRSSRIEEFSYDHVESHPNCAFCRMIAHVVRVKETLGFQFDMPSDLRRGATLEMRLDVGDSYLDVMNDKRIYQPRISLDFDRIHLRPLSDRDLPDGRLSSQLLGARRVRKHVRLDLLSSWLELCSNSHGAGCNARTWILSRKTAFRVIDVEKRCVIDPAGADNYTYVTLSYVWGSADMPQLKLEKNTSARLFGPNGLANHHEDIPTTIKNSMDLCQRLGKRYLWVDALCIYQDDPEDQSIQFQQMHHIYADSDFTIVAAAGASSWVGLPGITERVELQHVEVVKNFKIVNSLRTFREILHFSVWNTRAWTFQEHFFSKRLLYFTEEQVYFQCERELWPEDRFLESHPGANIKPLWNEDVDPSSDYYLYKFKGRWTHLTWLERYEEMVASYSNRKLTNASDVLNAFSGIAGALSEAMGCEFIWGLPAAYFEVALMFARPGPDCQPVNLELPTWSWASWMDSKGYTGHSISWGMYREGGEQFLSEIEWYQVRDNGYVKIENEMILKAGREADLAMHRAKWKPLQILELPALPDGLATSEKDRLLVFQTSAAFLQLIPRDPREPTRYQMPPGFIPHIAFSADGCGRKLTSLFANALTGSTSNPSHPQEFQPKMVEFLVIATHGYSQGGYYATYRGRLKLMAVETDERGISRRLDMASDSVEVDEWLAFRPIWRTVFLT
jgi:hypothetical protein